MKRLTPTLALALIVLLIAAFSLTACEKESWGVDRCDSLLDNQGTNIESMNAHHSCLPSYEADEQSNCGGVGRCTFVVQWNDGPPTVWVWDRNVASDHDLRIYASEGECHVRAYRQGLVTGYDAGVPPTVYQQCLTWAVSMNP